MPLLIDAIEAENDDDWIMPIETEDVIIQTGHWLPNGYTAIERL